MRLIIKLFLLLLFMPNITLAKTTVFVSIAPQSYFLNNLAGDLLDVQTFVPKGVDPHTFEPTPKQLRAIASAKAYFTIGLPFEAKWIPKMQALNPNLKIIATDKNIKKLDNNEKHDNHPADAEELFDPHIWLSPSLINIQAKNIYDGLIYLLPNNKEELTKNLHVFQSLINKLNGKIAQKLAIVPKNTRLFLIFHPSLAYFAVDYGFTQLSVEFEGKEPTPQYLAGILSTAEKNKVKTIIIQPQQSLAAATTIANFIGAKTVMIDILNYDVPETLLKITDVLQKQDSK